MFPEKGDWPYEFLLKCFIMCVLTCVEMCSQSIWKINMMFCDYYLKGNILNKQNRHYFQPKTKGRRKKITDLLSSYCILDDIIGDLYTLFHLMLMHTKKEK